MSFSMVDFLDSGIIMSLPHHHLLLGWGEAQTKTAKEVYANHPAFYLSDFFLTTPQPWVQYSHWMECSLEEFRSFLEPVKTFSTCDWIIDHPMQFKRAFHELSHALHSGRLKKAVPYLFAYSSELMTS